jgi:cob(I)alamin adenosyltransferase
MSDTTPTPAQPGREPAPEPQQTSVPQQQTTAPQAPQEPGAPQAAPRPGSAHGDSGYTDLLGRRRVAKHDPLIEAIGMLDEATSALGVAKSAAREARTRRLIHQAQHDLYEVMAELAFPPGHTQAVRLLPEHVDWLDRCVAKIRPPFDSLRTFVLPGACPASAPVDLARATVRSAERRLAQLALEGSLPNAHSLAYVNRLSLLLYYLARAEDVAAGVDFDVAGSPRERPDP